MSASVAKLLNDPAAVPMPSDAESEATPGTVSDDVPVSLKVTVRLPSFALRGSAPPWTV